MVRRNPVHLVNPVEIRGDYLLFSQEHAKLKRSSRRDGLFFGDGILDFSMECVKLLVSCRFCGRVRSHSRSGSWILASSPADGCENLLIFIGFIFSSFPSF